MKRSMRAGLALALASMLAGVLASPASAHGVEFSYALTPTVAIKVALVVTDPDGAPLNKADVIVFAPGPDGAAVLAESAQEDSAPEDSGPWLETVTDKEGRASFVPNTAYSGVWTIQVADEAGAAALHLPLSFSEGVAQVTSGQPVDVTARGLALAYTLTTINTVVVALDAQFDSGDPMAEAQITIYAPDNAKTPWLKGIADADGHYEFVADVTNPGTWEIQARQAGHGEWLKIALDETAVEVVDAPDAGGPVIRIADDVAKTSGDTGYSTGQVVLMSACVIWGFVGTALYFSRRRAPGAAPEAAPGASGEGG